MVFIQVDSFLDINWWTFLNVITDNTTPTVLRLHTWKGSTIPGHVPRGMDPRVVQRHWVCSSDQNQSFWNSKKLESLQCIFNGITYVIGPLKNQGLRFDVMLKLHFWCAQVTVINIQNSRRQQLPMVLNTFSIDCLVVADNSRVILPLFLLTEYHCPSLLE